MKGGKDDPSKGTSGREVDGCEVSLDREADGCEVPLDREVEGSELSSLVTDNSLKRLVSSSSMRSNRYLRNSEQSC